MESTEQSTNEVVRQVYLYAAQLMARGMSGKAITSELVSCGLSEEIAAKVVRELRAARACAMRKAGVRNMGIGVAACAIGLLISYATYTAAAASPTGGRYVVAWGAVVFGAIQCLRGLIQWSGN